MRSLPWTSRGGGRARVRRVGFGLLCASLLTLGIPASAEAQTSDASNKGMGTVVALDAGDLVLDLGTDAGVRVGETVELWRPLRVRHPVTKKWLEDRFLIGRLELIQVGKRLSLAKPVGSPIRAPKPGDRVLFEESAPAPTRPGEPLAALPPPHAAAPVVVAPRDEEARRLTTIFDSLRGKSPVARIRAYEAYVRANPKGRFAAVLYEEARSLRQLLLEPTAARSGQPTLVSFKSPRTLLSNTPVTLGVETTDVTKGAVLHLRTSGEAAYHSVAMVDTGAGYWSAVVPAASVRAPGLEYFIEASPTRGHAIALVGAADAPQRARVQQLPRSEPPAHRDASASISTDYADYNRLHGDDYAWQTEGTFGLRYQDVGVRAFRTGFGVYRGVGGTLDDLDTSNRQPRRVGLTYGYLELELGISPFVSVIGRGAVGLEDDGTTGGGQGMIRIGNDRSTNLMLGGEFLGGVGLRGFTQLELNTFERFPIVLRSEVTNQPAGVSNDAPRSVDDGTPLENISQGRGDLGARGIVQVGYRVVPELTLAGRVSYQGRTIQHAGPGLGAAVTYDW